MHSSLEVIEMKTSKYVYLVLGFAAFLGVIAVANQIDGFCTDTSILTMEIPHMEGYKSHPNFTLQTSFPTVPDELGIYSMTIPLMSVESTKKLAELKLKAAHTKKAVNVKDEGTAYSVATAETYVSVDKASAAETVLLDVPNLTAPRKAGLPSQEIIKQKAGAYVQEYNLLPEGYQYSGLSYITIEELGEQGPVGTSKDITSIIKYSRKIQGLDVEGPGSSINVMQGEGGAPLGYIKVSRTIGSKIAKSSAKAPGLLKTMAATEKTFELLTPEEAFEKLQERGLTSEIANVDTATVDNMYLAYWESETGKKQVETEPIYVFKGTATGPGGSAQYTEFMYALKEKMAKSPSQVNEKQAAKGKDRKANEPPLAKGEKDSELMGK
jgi:hypothetical protein